MEPWGHWLTGGWLVRLPLATVLMAVVMGLGACSGSKSGAGYRYEYVRGRTATLTRDGRAVSPGRSASRHSGRQRDLRQAVSSRRRTRSTA